MVCALADKVQHLIEFRGKQIQACQDTTVGTEIVSESVLIFVFLLHKNHVKSNLLFHDLLVIDGISDINVCSKRETSHSWIEIQYVRWRLFGMQVCNDSL